MAVLDPAYRAPGVYIDGERISPLVKIIMDHGVPEEQARILDDHFERFGYYQRLRELQYVSERTMREQFMASVSENWHDLLDPREDERERARPEDFHFNDEVNYDTPPAPPGPPRIDPELFNFDDGIPGPQQAARDFTNFDFTNNNVRILPNNPYHTLFGQVVGSANPHNLITYGSNTYADNGANMPCDEAGMREIGWIPADTLIALREFVEQSLKETEIGLTKAKDEDRGWLEGFAEALGEVLAKFEEFEQPNGEEEE